MFKIKLYKFVKLYKIVRRNIWRNTEGSQRRRKKYFANRGKKKLDKQEESRMDYVKYLEEKNPPIMNLVP